MQIFLLILFGILGGVFGGMGMGGGTLLIPLLTIFLGFNQTISQGFNLLSFLLMSIFALIIHFKNKLIELKLVFPIILGGVGFSVLGAFLANKIDTEILKNLFGIFLIVLSLIEVYKLMKN